MFQYLITAIFSFTFGALALRKQDKRAAFAAFCLFMCCGLWSLELFFLSYVKDITLLYPIFYATRWGLFFIPFTCAFFTYSILSKRSKAFRRIVLIPGAVSCALLCLSNITVFPSGLTLSEEGYLPTKDITSYWNMANFSYLCIASVVYCASSYPEMPFRERKRVTWVAITFTALLFMGWLSFYFFFKNDFLSRFSGAIINVAACVMIYHTLDARRLMSVSKVFIDGLSHLLVIILFVYLYFSLTSLVGNPAQSTGGMLFIFLYVLTVTQAYKLLVEFIIVRARKVFASTHYDHEEIKLITQDALSDCMSLVELTKVISNLVSKHMKLSEYRLLVIESQQTKLGYTEDSPHVSLIAKHSALVDYCVQHPTLVLRDETPNNVQEVLYNLKASAMFPLWYENEVIGIFLAGQSTLTPWYRYEDIVLLDWLNGELQQKVHHITALSLMQEELNESRKTLSMIGVMNQYHHDIKAPLAIIDGVLSEDIYDQEKQRSIVLEQVKRGTTLIATMASILKGKRKRVLSAVSLDNILRDSLLVLEKRFSSVNTEFSKVPEITGDAVDLKIMFINVIKNAVEAHRETAPLNLRVTTSFDDNEIFISIEDTGIGMPQEQLNSLWSVTNSSKKTGSGIGLQAIRRIADEHKATITVTSQPQMGTTFSFTFPRHQNTE